MKKTLTPIAAAFVVSIAATPLAAAENPFAVSDLANGYSVAWGDKPSDDKPAEGKCGEGKCGGDKAKKEMEGKCGGDKAKKEMEGKCGAK
ncbi:hypothetical protein [Sulfuriflexus mobilis]|uniref:HvfA family oxazolone/thioamide-modified RiPP metallophore n=1 Tax=Sulfuriflexus mobilis TaxID=1811807 RepID=UPI000F83898B|nr:hypothetical protein [Sulfuriflexus mobilis]